MRVYASIFQKITNLSPNLEIEYVGVSDVKTQNSPEKFPMYTFKGLWVNLLKTFNFVPLPFLKNRRVDPHKYMVRFFIVIFVFLKSENPHISNFKVRGQI